ncbi:cytochrome c [Castellaniella sp. MT123]|uniref:c-type cytochrome n=1 Tax=Castellaniella sp. MT123 TaxID=3140381 RepID=UPI0031F3B052
MIKTLLILNVALAATLSSVTASAADPAAGKIRYEATCMACHGAKGISIAPIYPNVAGQKDQYLTAQIKAFRDGTRKNDIMQPMAQGLTDSDIANIAAFLSTLKPE